VVGVVRGSGWSGGAGVEHGSRRRGRSRRIVGVSWTTAPGSRCSPPRSRATCAKAVDVLAVRRTWRCRREVVEGQPRGDLEHPVCCAAKSRRWPSTPAPAVSLVLLDVNGEPAARPLDIRCSYTRDDASSPDSTHTTSVRARPHIISLNLAFVADRTVGAAAASPRAPSPRTSRPPPASPRPTPNSQGARADATALLL